MRIYTLITILTISILMNGCLLDRIKQRLSVKKQIQNKQKVVQTQTVKEYKAPQVIEEKKVITKKVKKKVKKSKKVSKKSYKTKKIHKKKHIHKIEPEPYSIKKNEADPELLGPQTTLKSNPLSKKELIKKEKKI